MPKNDNTVNIESERRAYHHGDLRPALVQAGLEKLQTQSVQELSLREIARTVGVSPTAVYRHFPNKQSLLYALCEFGAAALYAEQDRAMRAAGGGAAGFAATGKAYIRYALANPALFRLLMTTKSPTEILNADEEHAQAAMTLLRRNVASLAPQGASPEQQRILVALAWSQVHGLAMLMLDGLVPVDETLIEAIGVPLPAGPTDSGSAT